LYELRQCWQVLEMVWLLQGGRVGVNQQERFWLACLYRLQGHPVHCWEGAYGKKHE